MRRTFISTLSLVLVLLGLVSVLPMQALAMGDLTLPAEILGQRYEIHQTVVTVQCRRGKPIIVPGTRPHSHPEQHGSNAEPECGRQAEDDSHYRISTSKDGGRNMPGT